MQDARTCALLSLYEIEYEGAYSNIALKKILKNSDFKTSEYYKEVPLRNIFKFLAKIPLIKECFVKMVVVICEK